MTSSSSASSSTLSSHLLNLTHHGVQGAAVLEPVDLVVVEGVVHLQQVQGMRTLGFRVDMLFLQVQVALVCVNALCLSCRLTALIAPLLDIAIHSVPHIAPKDLPLQCVLYPGP